jgi:hypothetical protein
MPITSFKSGTKSRSMLVGNAPAPVGRPYLWLDASDTSTISLSGNAVTQWTDKSANAYTFTQSTSTNRPSSGTRTINSKNVIDFDGTNDFLSSTAVASTWNFLHNSTGNTTFWVILPDTSANYEVISFTNEGQGSYTGFTFQYSENNPQNLFYGITSTAAVCNVSQTLTTGAAALYTFKADPANATLANRLKYYKNNGAATGSNTANGTVTNNDARITLQLGGYTGFTHFNGAIAEIIAYSSILSDADREKTRDYLITKWGL